ncbi:MAG: TrkA family potassium uptake protein, partial [Christensenellaceae bacterium]
MKRQFVVIGLGRFGTSVAKTLVEQGAEVLVIDANEEKVNQSISYATHAVQADATDEQALKSLGIRNFDVACVCLGEIQSSIMAALICKEQGIGLVIVKAQSEVHAKVLYKMGVDKVVFPERDTGIRVAHNILSSNILDFIELSDDYGIAELEVHSSWADKTLVELDFRKKYGVNIIAIRHSDETININPMPNDIILVNDVIIVIGSEEQI